MKELSQLTFWKRIKLFLQEHTKRDSLIKYLLLLLVILMYLIFVLHKFGAKEGLLITLLTWSFFVFCTPIADAGFLIDFPVRLITGMRMIYLEFIVWGIALFVNLLTFLFNPEIYNETLILNLFYYIISHPFPYWGIILISAFGTFFSIYFGDELMDVATHKNREKYHKHIGKYKLIVFIFVIALIIILYDFLLKNMGININL